MIGALTRAYANFRGFDLTHSAVPAMEGPLRPNTKLDALPVSLSLELVDNLVRHEDGLLCSSGTRLIGLSRREEHGATSALEAARSVECVSEISCLASDGGDALAIGLDGRGITIRGGAHDGTKIEDLAGEPFVCPSSAVFLDRDTLAVTSGSSRFRAADWKRDLMSEGETGSVWVLNLAAADPARAATRLAGNLSYPSGIAVTHDGDLYVAEAWRHRILSIGGKSGARAIVLEDLPAYPGRIAAATGGGFWLALFAPRNSMVEFVLLEKEYRRRMMETIEPEFWIAPNLAPSKSYLQPIQGGARKMLNRLKPWSPSWSYGLVCHCDASMRPRSSMHSRADGQVHGVTTLCEWDGVLFMGAKGSGVVVSAPVVETGGSSA